MAIEALRIPSQLPPARERDDRLVPARRRRGLFRLFVDALIESRQREADRAIARLIEMRGGKLTDELDRRIGRHPF